MGPLRGFPEEPESQVERDRCCDVRGGLGARFQRVPQTRTGTLPEKRDGRPEIRWLIPIMFIINTIRFFTNFLAISKSQD